MATDSMDELKRRGNEATWLISGVCLILLLIHLAAKVKYGGIKDGLDAITLGLTAVGLSPWIAHVLESFKFGGVEFKFVKQQLAQQEGDIAALRFLVGNFLTFWELHHLEALAAGKEFVADMEHYPESLKSELGRLRHMGLLGAKSGKGVGKLFSDPGRHKNVHDYLYVTDKGREWLKMVRAGVQENTAP
jgi:hypothetical protein